MSYSARELDELELAWATTVHKAQGGEVPVVVLALSLQHGPILSRRLLYTGEPLYAFDHERPSDKSHRLILGCCCQQSRLVRRWPPAVVSCSPTVCVMSPAGNICYLPRLKILTHTLSLSLTHWPQCSIDARSEDGGCCCPWSCYLHGHSRHSSGCTLVLAAATPPGCIWSALLLMPIMAPAA